MHPSIHHHQKNIFVPNDESIDIIIQGAIDNDATDNPVFVDEEGKMLEAPPLLIKEELKNGIDFDPTKLCVDWLLENTHVILWWCNGGRNQNWTYDEYIYQHLYNVDSDLCLDITDGHIVSRTPVNHYQCSANKNQVWIPPCYEVGHDCTGRIEYMFLVLHSEFCLDADSPIKPKNQVILFDCDKTLQVHLAQQWTMKWTGVLDDKRGHYKFYLVMDPSSKKLKGLSPPKKPS